MKLSFKLKFDKEMKRETTSPPEYDTEFFSNSGLNCIARNVLETKEHVLFFFLSPNTPNESNHSLQALEQNARYQVTVRQKFIKAQPGSIRVGTDQHHQNFYRMIKAVCIGDLILVLVLIL